MNALESARLAVIDAAKAWADSAADDEIVSEAALLDAISVLRKIEALFP